LIQPLGPLLYNGGAVSFRKNLFETYAIDRVFDFTALEGILFHDKKERMFPVGASNALKRTFMEETSDARE
jgi:hypothetical protein